MRLSARNAKRIGGAACLVVLVLGSDALPAQESIPNAPPNLIRISDRLTTAGQPSAEWLRTVKQQEFDAVIYLAQPTVSDAIREEPEIVRSQGLAFVNIPIVFSNSTAGDFEAFTRTMRALEGKRVLVHCQVNMRASVLAFLYRVIHDRQDPARAYDSVSRVWTPQGPWKRLIQEQLRQNRIDFDPF